MSKLYPKSFVGNVIPWLLEGEAHDLPVTGTLPPILRGTLYRNGPNPFFARSKRHLMQVAGRRVKKPHVLAVILSISVISSALNAHLTAAAFWLT